MQQSHVRRARAASIATVAVTAGLLAPSAAHAAVGSTSVTSPVPDQVFDGSSYSIGGVFGDVEPTKITVTGLAPGAEDGDEVLIACAVTTNGATQLIALNFAPTEVEDGAFSQEVAAPPYTCRIRAVPAELAGAPVGPAVDLSPYAGPMAFGGIYAKYDFGEVFGDPSLDGAESYESFRGQRHGIGFTAGLAAINGSAGTFGAGGGIAFTVLMENEYFRYLFGPSAQLSGFGGFPTATARLAAGKAARAAADIEDAGLVVDDVAAVAIPTVGDVDAKVVSRAFNPATGDQTVVETIPVAKLVGDPDDPTPEPAGLELQRTTTQDHEGEQIRVTDVFRSTDGAAHRIEARYGESVFNFNFYDDEDITVEKASFRVPWKTGADYVVPSEGDTFGPAPAGPTTIWVHGPRQDFTGVFDGATRSTKAAARADGDLPRRAEGAYQFDQAPTDGKFLSETSFVVRFVKDVPAGGTASIAHSYSQDLTPGGLDELVNGAPPASQAPPAAAPLPATTPLPSQPAPSPAPRPFDPLPTLARSTGRVLLTPAQGRRLRDRKPVTVTTKGMPAGRYGVTIRRRVPGGRTIASGIRTIRQDGELKVTLRLTKYGKRYLAQKKTRRAKSVPVRVIVTWTPPGQGRKRQQTSYPTNFR